MLFLRNAALHAQYLHILNLPCYRNLRQVGMVQVCRCRKNTTNCALRKFHCALFNFSKDANFYLNLLWAACSVPMI